MLTSETVTAPICPYCSDRSVFTDSAEVYHGRSYGQIYLCRPCQAWVGCHRDTTKPLGRLADKTLRTWKKRAHAAFDPHWKSGRLSRPAAYRLLANRLGIPIEQCHIGMFNVTTCQEVVRICNRGRGS